MSDPDPQLPAYERTPYCSELEVRVRRQDVDDEGNPYAVLDDTILYPAGGGQPADHGSLGKTSIVEVQRVGEEIRHFHDGELDAAATRLRLDWPRRYDHMQQHTGQHLLTAIAAAELGWETTSFHLGAEVADIELDTPTIGTGELERLEDLIVDRIRENLVVSVRHVDAGEIEALGVRSRGLPEGHRGNVRVVEIGNVDRTACGGTHVAGTGEVETIALLGSESMRGGTRLYWLAGSRVRRRLLRQRELLTATRLLFETSEAELLAVATAKLDRLTLAEREVDVLGRRLAREAARRLQAESRRLIEDHFDGADATFLRQVAAALRGQAPASVVFLTTASENGNLFLLSAGEALDLDLRSLGQRVAGALDGRGGGAADLVQGKAGSLAGRATAVALLHEVLAHPTR